MKCGATLLLVGLSFSMVDLGPKPKAGQDIVHSAMERCGCTGARAYLVVAPKKVGVPLVAIAKDGRVIESELPSFIPTKRFKFCRSFHKWFEDGRVIAFPIDLEDVREFQYAEPR